ncbi:MAG: type-4 uracil-DNA glycosylase [Candidatus Nezhaarchaeales archaeon]|nr:MAG: uracil-DNA glycosylase [Candidatus Nezhaarchaeota archaeon WYZ-LMO8]TDA36839.1 MAG: uracil-DNA glycosylase [Candidatus Nezhaarchaeota archaeon WYZ-LMO7]
MENERVRILEEVAREVASCRKCRLWSSRMKPVPGQGDVYADVMLVGEAPGYNEDVEGRPFVGAAGKFLDKLLEMAGFRRDEVFITNILKCRPPGNRDPLPDEVDACTPYLDKQVAVIKPKLIVCLGRYSTNYILLKGGVKTYRGRISTVRGQVFKINFEDLSLLVVPTYHPAAGLYNPKLKNMLINDFILIGKVVRGIRERGVDV